MRLAAAVVLCAALLGGCASQQAAPSAVAASAAEPVEAACPSQVPAGAHCYTGEDGAGAFYWIAIPAGWNSASGVLVMHAHGGPADTGPAKAERSRDDLQRWAVTVKAGYAWAGSTYSRGGYGVTMAAEDTERLRRIFVQRFGQPRRTILHGQSYGAGVAAKAAELYGGANSPYDGVLLTSGVLGGGTRAYDFRLDLRVIYQYVCRNHPKADEPQYPLWMGSPADSKLTRAELAARVDECTGVNKAPAERTPQQRERLATILKVVRIPEKSLVGHLDWATWQFRDLTQLRLQRRNPFGNVGAIYTGSHDDATLNQQVLRYAADRAAVEALAQDSAPTGQVGRPTLTLHAIDDPIAFVELESLYRDIRERAGTGNLLVQTFSEEAQHSFLSAPEYAALFTALLDWIDRGEKPTPATVLQLCRGNESAFGAGCHIRPEYTPASLDARVTPRDR
jgi:hypothetical protein